MTIKTVSNGVFTVGRNHVLIQDGVRKYKLPVNAMCEFRSVGLSNIEERRRFDIPDSTVYGYFHAINALEDTVQIDFVFGDHAISTVAQWEVLIKILFELPDEPNISKGASI